MDDRLKLYSVKQLSDYYKLGHRVFGVSKAYPPASRDTWTEDKLRGNTGEQIVSGLLNMNVIDTEDMFVCHSIGTHDDTQGETDHVLIYKNSILIVETKTSNGYNEIRISKEGTALGRRNGTQYKFSDNKLINKIEQYQKRFPNRKVKGLLTIARYGIATSSSHDKYDVACLKNFQTKINDWVSSTEPIKEDAWPAVKFFASLCLRSYQ
jgi:hypothetical protein